MVLIGIKENLGFAGGNNIGIRFAAASKAVNYIWLLNNDTIIDDNTISKLVERMEEADDAGLCGATVLFYNKADRIQALGGARYNQWTGLVKPIGTHKQWPITVNRDAVEKQIDYVFGASIFVSLQFIKRVGLMDEAYFLYFEELDWIYRAPKKFKLLYAPDAIVYHKEGASIGSSSNGKKRSPKSYYWLLRSRIRFTRKFYPLCTFPVGLVALLQLIWHGFRHQNLKGVFAGLQAIVAGISADLVGSRNNAIKTVLRNDWI